MKMKTWLSLVLFCGLYCAVTFMHAQTVDFQTGKVTAVEKVGVSGGASGGTDGSTSPDVNKFNLTIQLGDTAYVCRAKTQGDMDLDWTLNKEVQAKAKGNTMYVKRSTGKLVKLSILSSSKAK